MRKLGWLALLVAALCPSCFIFGDGAPETVELRAMATGVFVDGERVGEERLVPALVDAMARKESRFVELFWHDGASLSVNHLIDIVQRATEASGVEGDRAVSVNRVRASE